MAFATKTNLKFTALALALASIGAQADTFTWANDVSGLWTLPTSWAPLGPPNNGADVIISVTGVKTITHNLGNDSIRTLNFEASSPDPTAVLLINSGSQLTVTSGGANGGTIRADNGTVAFSGGTLVNSGTLNAINSGVVSISQATIQGGTLSTDGTGAINVTGSATLDGSTHGAMTLSGNVNVVGGQTVYALGTLNDNNLNIGNNAALILRGGNLTLAKNGTTTLGDVNSQIFGSNGNEVLTNTAGNTIQGSGQIGVNRTSVVNAGTITANVQGGAITLDPTDGVGNFINTGTLSAANGGQLVLNTGTYTNAGGLITAGAGSSVQILGSSTVIGGTLSTTGTGSTVHVLQSAVLDGQSQGAINLNGNIVVDGGQTAYALGTLNDNNLNIGNNAALVIRGGNLTLANNGTTTLGDVNSQIFGSVGTEVLTNTLGNTIQGSGQIGVNRTSVVNAGTITSNIMNGTITLDPNDGEGNFINTGTLSAVNGGAMTLNTGTYTNTGAHITAGAGSVITVTNGSIVEAGTLTATGTGAAINFQGSSVIDGLTHGAITLTGNVNVVGGQTAYALGTLNDNNLTVGANASLIIRGGDLTLANNGTTTLTDLNTAFYGAVGTEILTNTAGNTIQGAGQIGANRTDIRNAGLITANAGNTITLDPNDGEGHFINTGILRAENGGSLFFTGGTYNNAAGTINIRDGSSATFSGGSTILEGGTVTTAGSGTVTFNGSAILDGSTHGTLNLSGNVSVQGGQTAYTLGTINDNNLTVGANASLIIRGDNLTLANNGTTTLTDINTAFYGATGSEVLTNTAGNTIQGVGQIGANRTDIRNAGLITANAGGPITLDPNNGEGHFINTGAIRAENGGSLVFNGGNYNNAGGTINVRDGASALFTGGATFLEGGTISTAGSGTITFNGSAVLDGTTNGAITSTAKVVVQGGQTAYATGSIIDNGTIVVGGNAALLVVSGTNLTLTGTGTLTMTDSNTAIYGPNGNEILTNGAGHTIQGVGQLGANRTTIVNAGTINANVSGSSLLLNTTGPITNQSTGVLLASNGGTLNIDKAVTGTGTIRTDTGGTVILNQASTTGQLINNGNLRLSGNVTVSSDYNNANFGVGNAFNRNANVTGGGAILAAGNVAEAITGTNVTSLGPTASALTIGNVRVGANTFNYQVAATGTTGPSLRGAIQTQFSSGSGITDSRLSGTGVTAGNYGPVAVGTQSGDFGVTFTAASAGTLAPLANSPGYGTGQAVFVANNFSNVFGQVLQINLASGAAAFNAAIGSASPSPIAFGNVRVGGALSQALTVSNTQTAGSFSEDLNASFGASAGSASGAGSLTGLVAGGSNSSALVASLSSATAGAKSGTVTVNYATAGTVAGTSNGLGTLGVGSQTIALSGNVYNAAVGSTSPSPVVVANQRVNGTNSSALTVSNTAAAGSFSEALNASFGGTTGTVTTNGGSVSNLVAGGSSAGALAVGVNTQSAGAKSGVVTIGYQTTGQGPNGNSGLAAASAGSQNIAVSGNVYQTAAGAIQSAPLNFGTVQVGQNVSQSLTIRNTATGASGFVEDLNASFGATSGTGSNLITGSGSLGGILAGTNSTAANGSLIVSVNTSSAGMVNGGIAVNYASAGAVNGVSNGLGTLGVGSETYGVAGTIMASANVVNQASPVINNSPIALGNVRIGSTSPTGIVSVTNQATTSPQAALNASISGNAGITASGSFNLLNPGATNNTNLIVGLDTTTAGNKSGSATIGFVSDASNIGNCAPNCQLTLAPQNVAVTGAVYRLANPTSTPTSITVAGRVGGPAATTAIGITNVSADQYTEGLTVSRGATSAGFTSTGAVTNLVAGGTSNSIGVTLNTANAGTFVGTQALNYVSTGAGTTGAADISVGSVSVALNGKVYTTAAATNNTPSVNFGIVHVGDTVNQNVSVTNSAATSALNDTLNATALGASGPFTASGSVSGLAAQATSTALSVGLNTANAGVYSGSAAFSAASHDADQSDAALANLAVSLAGQVNNYASDAFAFGSGAGTLTQSSSTYVLDYGTVAQGSGTRTTTLTALNSATGPADLLDGSFQFQDMADFGESGFSSFLDLIAGQSTGSLTFSFDAMTTGLFTDTITLHGVGHNASGFSAAIGDITLQIRANVTGTVTPPVNGVPEPDSLLLIGLGIPLLFLRRKNRASRPAAR